jgi:serine phosphatase RsbU (regulator of sigma subunit)
VRTVFILLLAITLQLVLLAPILAINWSKEPFPGFLVEQTLVVTDANGQGWSGRAAGLAYPQKVTQIDSTPVLTAGDFNAVINNHRIGDEIQVTATLPDGTSQTFSAIRLAQFPRPDLMRMFWLPYAVSIIYLFLGTWIFQLSKDQSTGRAFAYFCVCTAITLTFLFDLATTHLASAVWTTAIAQIGGALTCLALVFPSPAKMIRVHPRLQYLPYALSITLSVVGLFTLYDYQRPWLYISAWRLSYAYAAVAILIFIATLLLRLRPRETPTIRKQARTILIGSLVAFLPVGVWFAAPQFGISLQWNPALYLPLLLLFPLSIGLAIQRYHLWDFDVLLNRVVIYGLLTLVLVLVYVASIVFVQMALTDYVTLTPTMRTILLTFIILALFSPAKNRIQEVIDRRFFRHKYDAARSLAAFSQTLRHEIDLERLVSELLRVIKETMQPGSVALCLYQDSSEHAACHLADDDPLPSLLRSSNEMLEVAELKLESPALQRFRQAGAALLIPLVSQDEMVGVLSLGKRNSGQPYSVDDRRLLSILAGQAAPALQVAQMVQRQQAEALHRQSVEHELEVARLVQMTQLPAQPPELPGWRFTAFYRPAAAIGGEFYDFVQLPGDRLGIVIGDVAARGTPAALVMAHTRGLISAFAQEEASPARLLERVNQLLIPDTPEKIFVTCFLAAIDPQNGEIRFSNAGHDQPYRILNGSVQPLEATGLPLGVFPEARYDEYQATLAAGESLLFYSDGLVEARSRQRLLLSFPGLEDLLRARPSGPDGLIPYLLHSVDEFAGQAWVQEDDVTMVTVQYLPDDS